MPPTRMGFMHKGLVKQEKALQFTDKFLQNLQLADIDSNDPRN